MLWYQTTFMVGEVLIEVPPAPAYLVTASVSTKACSLPRFTRFCEVGTSVIKRRYLGIIVSDIKGKRIMINKSNEIDDKGPNIS